ncbi:roadblock/LC7 domain-containing protein [Ottowia sp.]|uniref:roadblock/LC7 domain-containing protein n=1 Tax=Ottowia sp. TaxID=1898956 RepID=UPI0039E64DB4
MTVKLNLPATVKVLAQRGAQAMLAEIDGVTAVVVATVDGFDVASAMRVGDAARVAAMASSISAISSVVSQEANLGRNKCVTIDTESGFAVVYSVHRPDAELVINAIADGNAILGQVNYRTAQFARTLADA